jgi:hypothetical protein
MTGCTCAGNGLIAALPGWAEPLVEASRKAGEDTVMALRLAEEFGRLLPQPGYGDTAARWAVLAAASRESLTVGRVLEAHSDALTILAEAGEPVPAGTWGCSRRRRHRTGWRHVSAAGRSFCMVPNRGARWPGSLMPP